MKSLFESIISKANVGIAPEVEMDNFSKTFFSEEQWKTIIAATIVLAGDKVKITKLTFKHNDDRGVDVSIEYSGKKMNCSNNLWIALRLKDAIRGMDKFIRGVDDKYLSHTIRDNLAQVTISKGISIGSTWKDFLGFHKEQEVQVEKLKNSIKL